jgi:large subunit ribosomal protein L18
MISKIDRKAERQRRHIRVRRKISGTTECPRLAVCRTNKNIIAQIIDDTEGKTLVYVSTLDKDVKTKAANKEAAKEVGALIAKKAIEKGIETVVYDRGGFVYHGVVKELADAAREAGLKF